MEEFGLTVLLQSKNEADAYSELMRGDVGVVKSSWIAESLRLLEECVPDCVFLDMDDAGSEDDLQALVANGAAVIALSSRVDDADHFSAISLGAQESLNKERVDKRVLQRTVRTVIERHKLMAMAGEAMKALKYSEERFDDIANHINQGLWVRSGDDQKCIYINPAFEEIWGRNLEQMNEQTWALTIHPDDRQDRLLKLMNPDFTEDYVHTYRIVRPDGTIRWVENHGYAVLDGKGKMIRRSGIAIDITKQKQLEEELRLAQKLEGLGQLSAGIAHEVNTPCQFVSDNLTFLRDAVHDVKALVDELPALLDAAEESGTDPALCQKIRALYDEHEVDFLLEELPVALEQSKGGMDQIRKIVQAMKGFAHPGDAFSLADINATIRDIITVSRNEWKYVAVLETEFEEEVCMVECVRSAINQVILNFIVNAAHAIDEKLQGSGIGKISVSTRRIKDSVKVSVRDDGTGMSESLRNKIFDPFFTTKEVGKGTGQGLAIVHKIICDDHGGSVAVESEEGVGTCFSIVLPLAQELPYRKEDAA